MKIALRNRGLQPLLLKIARVQRRYKLIPFQMYKPKTALKEFDKLLIELRQNQPGIPELRSAIKVNVFVRNGLQTYLDEPDRALLITIFAQSLDLLDEVKELQHRYPNLGTSVDMARKGALLIDTYGPISTWSLPNGVRRIFQFPCAQFPWTRSTRNSFWMG